jgi:hypothetical protein
MWENEEVKSTAAEWERQGRRDPDTSSMTSFGVRQIVLSSEALWLAWRWLALYSQLLIWRLVH